MKRSIVILLFITGLIACQKDDVVFSCDPEINKWVLEVKNQKNGINRDELAMIPLRKQVPLFRSFKPEKKVQLWNEKLSLLIASSNLTEKEKTHISKLKDYLKPHHYGNKEKRKEFQDFAYEWEAYAREYLFWDDYELYIYVHTLLSEEEILKQISNRGVDDLIITPPGGKPDCECLYDIYCAFGLQLCDKKSGCNQTDGGCGIVGTSNCRGVCD